MLTEPLHQLATTAQAISHDRDYTRRVERADGDEIGAVADAFNDMMAQVDLAQIIEDTRRVLAALLEGQGAEIETAASVAAARDALSRRIPDVVISDLAMPREDGYTLLAYCRHHSVSEVRQVRLIALTAFAGEQARESILRAGFDGYLTKPIDPGAVSRMIAATASSEPR